MYHREARIDPNYVKTAPGEDSKARRALTREDCYKVFTGALWEAFRSVAYKQLAHLAVRRALCVCVCARVVLVAVYPLTIMSHCVDGVVGIRACSASRWSWSITPAHNPATSHPFSSTPTARHSKNWVPLPPRYGCGGPNCLCVRSCALPHVFYRAQMLLSLDTLGVFKVAPVPPRHHKASGWVASKASTAIVSSLYEVKASNASTRVRKAVGVSDTPASADAPSTPAPSRPSRQAPAALAVDVIRGGAVVEGSGLQLSSGPLAVGHVPWQLPNVEELRREAGGDAGATARASPSSGRGSVASSPQGAGKEPNAPTVVDVDELADCVCELALLYEARLYAHMEFVVRCAGVWLVVRALWKRVCSVVSCHVRARVRARVRAKVRDR